MARRNDPTKINLEITDIRLFENNSWVGFKIEWDSDIGFGTYTIYKKPGEKEWHGDSEYMDSNKDKAFLHELLRLFFEKIKIEG